MRAIGYQKSLPIENEAALTDIDLPKPAAKGRDLLVQIQAVSVNPVDTKIRKRTDAGPEPWKVLGWDAAGIVMIDDGVLQSTLADNFGAINAQNLRRAHALIESGRAKGKIVLEGFDEDLDSTDRGAKGRQRREHQAV